MIKYLMSKMYTKFNYGLVICPTAYDGYDWLPQEWIHETPFPEEGQELGPVQRLYNLQQTVRANHAFLILDDCLGTIHWNEPFWMKLVTTTRHSHITIIIATQHCAAIPTFFRGVVNYAFIFRQNTEQSLDSTYKTFGQSFRNMNGWRDYLFSNLREKYWCIKYSRDAESPYVKFKAPDMTVSRFKIVKPKPKKKTVKKS